MEVPAGPSTSSGTERPGEELEVRRSPVALIATGVTLWVFEGRPPPADSAVSVGGLRKSSSIDARGAC